MQQWTIIPLFALIICRQINSYYNPCNSFRTPNHNLYHSLVYNPASSFCYRLYNHNIRTRHAWSLGSNLCRVGVLLLHLDYNLLFASSHGTKLNFLAVLKGNKCSKPKITQWFCGAVKNIFNSRWVDNYIFTWNRWIVCRCCRVVYFIDAYKFFDEDRI